MKGRGKKKPVKHRRKLTAPNRDTYSNGRAVVNMERLAPNRSLDTPGFVKRGYYEDEPFRCQDCGAPQLWTARQQKWWYEVAQGDVFTNATRCWPCRRRERERREAARRVHLEGLTKKGKA